MVRGLVKLVLVALVLVAGAFYLFGYWTGGSLSQPAPSAAETPPLSIDTAAARERGAEIGEQAAKAVATALAACSPISAPRSRAAVVSIERGGASAAEGAGCLNEPPVQ